MKKVQYAVVILNYNTIDDAIEAAESVIQNAKTDSFVVCIADNASSKKENRNKCAEYRREHVVTVCLENNSGYARGNNEAIYYLKQQYEPQYYVIMNPDVKIIECGTIEKMIARIEQKGEPFVGGQPLVWNCNYAQEAQWQQNIRRTPDFLDICMLSFLPLKAICKKRYDRMIYAKERPYNRELPYLVPSGAFFIIKAETFEEIGFFDEGTFLYYEEHIVGKKLEEKGKQLLFMPQYKVRHEHGKSTGSNHYAVNKFALKCSEESRLYYTEKYLHRGGAAKAFVLFLGKLNLPFEYIKVFVYNYRQHG